MLNHLLAHGWASTPGRLSLAAAVPLGFAFFARAVRGVNWSGALTGAAVSFLLFVGAGPGAFACVGVLFGMTWASTRIGYRSKQTLGLAESRDGRNGWQVLANLAAAAGCSVAFGVSGKCVWLIMLVATLAEAATDTVASEIGQFRRLPARSITTWQLVPAGTDGGITISGTLAGMIAGVLISILGRLGGMVGGSYLWIPIAAGIVGMLFDSVLGASVQRRGLISNQTVNLLSTLAAALVAFMLF